MRYCSNEDISVAIQCLKVITEKKNLDDKTKRIINPRLLRVMMELEDMIGND